MQIIFVIQQLLRACQSDRLCGSSDGVKDIDHTVHFFFTRPRLLSYINQFARGYKLMLVLSVFIALSITSSFAQTAGDYKSVGSGDWDAIGTWEIFNGTWATPTVGEGWPGQNAGTGAVTIQALNNVTIPATLTTNILGTVTINGDLTFSGDWIFSLNTMQLIVTPGLLPEAKIFLDNKSELKLPAGATIYVVSGGIVGSPCSNNTNIYIGSAFFSCQGGGGSIGKFEELYTPNLLSITPAAFCGTGTVNLGATPSSGSTTVSWFDTSSGGASLATGTSFTTPMISTTTTYYAEAKNTITGYVSSPRTAVIATINPTPTLTGASQAATVCAGSAATISLTGLLANSTSTVLYSINAVPQAAVTGVIADGAGAANFTSASLTATNNGQTLQITGITTTSATPNCNKTFTQNVTMVVDPAAVGGTIASAQTICQGTSPANLTLSGNTGTVTKWQSSTDVGFTTPTDIAVTTTTLLGATIGNLSASTYFKAVVQSGTCAATNSASVLITVNSTPTAIVPFTQSFCNGAVAVLSLTGTPAGVVFDITGGAAIGLNNIAGAAANPAFTAITNIATITITPRANGCAGAAVTSTITVSPPPTVTIAPPAQTICSKDPTAFAISSFSVGATFSWTVGAIVPAGSITGASAGSGANINQQLTNTTTSDATVTYSIVATVNGCAGSPVDVTATVKPAPNLVVNNPAPVCAPSTVDLTAAAITAGSSGGLALNYWQDAAATIPYPTPSTAGNGTYYIGGFDAVSGCTAIFPVTVVVNIQPQPTLVITNPASVCSGTVDITLPAITSGSTAPLLLTYWMDAAATITYPTPGTADADTYYIKGSTAFCSDVKSVIVTVASTLGIPIFAMGASSNICKGYAPITYTAVSANSSGLTYDLDAASKAAGNAINAAGQVTFAPGWVGTSYVTATATGCGAPTQAIHTVKVNDPPSVALSASTLGPVCEGTPITLTATNSGGSTLKTISKSSGNINVPVPESRTLWAGSLLAISGFGTATIAATDIIEVNLNITHATVSQLDIFIVSPTGGCMLLSRNNGGTGNNYSATLRTNYSPNINTLKGVNSVTIAGSYGTEDLVSDLAPQTGGFGGNYNNTAVPQSKLLGAIIDGNWEVRVFDDKNNTHGTLVNWSLTITKQIGTGFTTVVNGPPTIGAVNYSGAFNTTATAVVTPPAGTNNYTVTTTDANGCFTTSNAVALVIKPSPKPTITADYCLVSKKIHLTATGVGTYLWNTTETTPTIDVDIAGINTVKVTSVNGCIGTASINVANELVTNGNFSMGNTGFSTPLSGGNRYTYVADNPIITNELWNAGVYGIGTKGNNYHDNFWGVDHTSGTGNFMIINGFSGFQPVVWQETVTVIPNTDYYFSAYAISLNDAGNYAHLQFSINGIPFGTDAQLTAGTNNNGNPWKPQDRFYGTWPSGSATTAIIEIIDLQTAPSGNDFGLDDISFGTLMASPATIHPDVITSQCEGTNIDLKANVTGGIPPFTYAWTGPNSFTSSLENPSIANVTSANEGDYTLIFSDGYGCATLTKTFNITIKPAATVNAGPDQHVFVSAPSVTLAGVFGGAALSGTWSGGTGSYNTDNQKMNAVYTPSAAEITAGSVTLTLTTSDPGSPCSPAVDQVKINIYPIVTAQITASARPLCIGGSTGSATASASGGTAPYSYSWNTTPVKITATVTNLPAGTYTVTIIDKYGSTDTKSVTLTDPPALVVDNNILITKPSCYGANDGKAEVIIISGDPPTYLWSNGQTTNPATGLIAGNYTVKATWANGCAATNINVAVTQPTAPTIACPADVTMQAAAGFTYAGNVTVPAPVYTNDCPMVTQTWEMTGVTTANSPLTGINPINPRNFDIGVTNIKYTIIDGAGNSRTCTFKITVEQQIGPTIFTAGATLFCQNAPDETYTATATNSTSIAYSVLPATAGVMNPATGVMNWDAAFSGNAFISATATGPSGTTNATQTVTVTPTVGTPIFTLGLSSARDQGVGPFPPYTATASNNTGITYSLDAASLAGGNTIDAGTGLVTYTALWSWKSIITATATGCNGPKTADHVVGVNWCYALFTANGALSCAGASKITGNVGTFVGATTGFTIPTVLLPPGRIDAEATPASAQAAAQTVAVYNDLAAIPCGINSAGITLAGPTTLTPNVYCYSGALTITGDITLSGGPNAVFIFKINGALTTNTGSNIILTGGAKYQNVYWRVYGAVVLSGAEFKGTIVNEGAFTVNTGAILDGRALSINGAIAITDNKITSDCYPLFSVPDNTKPIFVPPADISECVENLSNVAYNPLTTVINPDRPDYYTYSDADIRLDLNTALFTDDEPLTCPSNIRWEIDFSPASDFNPPYGLVTQPPITGFGQPSEHIGSILFPGDGVGFNPVVHHITWWIKDCAGNESPPQTRSITINPRPKVQ